ncbi:NADH-quinone oxidoreductase subunit J family protein [Halocatena halophila]|uniref:NADH-quinone oxidoreductase subunit J family protein n=1 Tax=Halocatena halophila TaxID=2814576 RepID=UPI002ED3AA98
MTTRPRLKLGSHLLPGLAAVALFAVMAAVFLQGNFPAPAGFGDGSVLRSIGMAMFALEPSIPSANFLVAFEIIDVVLVAALVGAVMLARREGDDSSGSVRTDGGRGDDR